MSVGRKDYVHNNMGIMLAHGAHLCGTIGGKVSNDINPKDNNIRDPLHVASIIGLGMA